MANKTTKASKPKNIYEATDSYKIFMSEKGLLTEDQHKGLLKGDSVDLTGASEKQMAYLITNNLIKGE
mgnify:CR=1 FL=1|tara:strand:- start:1077 stop:1280 length:204 start_codon:yes stop_codon:yes gene_type:complete